MRSRAVTLSESKHAVDDEALPPLERAFLLAHSVEIDELLAGRENVEPPRARARGALEERAHEERGGHDERPENVREQLQKRARPRSAPGPRGRETPISG